jgi:hypothetical protein
MPKSYKIWDGLSTIAADVMKKVPFIVEPKEKAQNPGLEPGENPPFTFCEPVWASGIGRWCIRKTTEKGPKFGGGIDTPSLCGHVPAGKGWDLEVRITEHHLNANVCSACAQKYKGLVADSKR